MASSETRNLGFAIAALVGFGAMMVWVLTGSSTVSRAPDNAQANRAEASSDTAEARSAPAGPLPDFMIPIHARVLDKQWLDVEAQKSLYHFGREHKDDARPQLLLAWDS